MERERMKMRPCQNREQLQLTQRNNNIRETDLCHSKLLFAEDHFKDLHSLYVGRALRNI